MKNCIVEQSSYQYAIHHKGDIVTHEHGADKAVGMIIEERDQSLGHSVLVLVLIHLGKHSVGRHKGYLHATEKAENKSVTNMPITRFIPTSIYFVCFCHDISASEGW